MRSCNDSGPGGHPGPFCFADMHPAEDNDPANSRFIEKEIGNSFQRVSLALVHPMEKPMTKSRILSAGFIAGLLVTPVMAQEATQEPGLMAQYYPNTDYVTGGYGHRMTPGPRYYYRYRHYGLGTPDIGVVRGAVVAAPAIAVAPYGGYGS
ncbi:MAG: hypothetical protein QOC84_2094, partial [Bradyrhizobium sp.]|nr:hypothetical protein [Bradyrhizobium sp.]